MAPNIGESFGPRLGALEQKVAVHEAVCAERYKALDLQLRIIMGILGAMLLMMVGGSPLIASVVQRVTGGH